MKKLTKQLKRAENHAAATNRTNNQRFKMAPKKIITGLLVVFALASFGTVIVKEFVITPKKVTSSNQVSKALEKGKKVVVYYFHGNQRCATCKTIEAYTQEAVSLFNETDKVQIKAINVEERSNEHFVKDYELSNRSVVLSNIKNGSEVEWIKLDKVWNYVGNKDLFLTYVKENIQSVLKKQI